MIPPIAQGKQGNEIPFYKVSDMNLLGNERFMLNANNSITKNVARHLNAYIFPTDTIIFPKVGGAMLTNKRRLLTTSSCIDNNVMGCILKKHRALDFFFLIMTTLDFGKICKPGPVPAISEGEVRAIRICWPPCGEQQEIIDFLSDTTTTIDTAISRAEREIDLMREYRDRLIADVVTGQIDVRGMEVPKVSDSDLTLPVHEDVHDIPEVDDTEGDDAED